MCSKSMLRDMSRFNRRMDMEILRTVMPEDYARHRRRVLCNDCEKESVRFFHVIGHKCSHCGGYNTRVTAGEAPATALVHLPPCARE